jgi:hypothetical protein
MLYSPLSLPCKFCFDVRDNMMLHLSLTWQMKSWIWTKAPRSFLTVVDVICIGLSVMVHWQISLGCQVRKKLIEVG